MDSFSTVEHAITTQTTEASLPAFVVPALRQHGGHTMAYATTQTGLSYFETNDGYLAHEGKWGFQHVLGDPVVPRQDSHKAIAHFLQEHPKAVFWHIHRHNAAYLSEQGFYVNELGVDPHIELDGYDFSGKKKAKIRQAARKFDREGYRVAEVSNETTAKTILDQVSKIWKTSRMKASRELRFLNRPLTCLYERDARTFVVYSADGQPVAFYIFDPLYEAGSVIGYSLAVKRRAPQAPCGCEEAVVKFAVETFQQEQRQVLSFGLVPLYRVEDQDFAHSKITSAALKKVYHSPWCNRRLFNFRGQADFKHRFRGEPHKIYFATRSKVNSFKSLQRCA